MGLSAAEQKRHATVREEVLRVEEVCGELVKALSEDVEALGERVTKEGQEWRAVCQTLEGLYLQADREAVRLQSRLEDERETRQGREETLRSAHRAFVGRGFWGRVGWLVRGR